jgi:predicted amidohydrolase
MVSSIRATAMQLQAHAARDFPARLDRIVAQVRRAALDSDLVVLPEGTFPGYVLGRASVDENAVAAALLRLRDVAVATQTVIVVGAAASTESGIRNGAYVIDANGSPAGRADKLFLWHFDRRWFVPGERLEPIATVLGELGVLVCADGRLPTIARALVDRGAVALVMPTAWVTSGRDPDALENVQADLLARIRAYENAVPFIAANKCGSELGIVAYCGKSQIVDAHGEVVAMASEREPQMVTASVTLGSKRPPRAIAARPPARVIEVVRPFRLAIAMDRLPDDVDSRLELLDDSFALSPQNPERFDALDVAVGAALVEDEVVRDPGGLVAYRRAGYRLICWATALHSPWTERLARARALELRLYVVVFDNANRRAFAVDPDGAIIAGTFDGYRLASFVLDPRKTAETSVAPGTDVGEGLERVEAIVK